MSEIKMVATDLDGTFFNNQRGVNEAKFSALLDYFDAHDLHFVIATGNDQPLVDHVFRPFIGRFDYAVNNGGQVKTKTGELLREAHFERSDGPKIQKLIEDAQLRLRHGIIFNGQHDSYMLSQYRGQGDLYDDIRWYFPDLKFIDDFSEIPTDETIIKIIFSALPEDARQFIDMINRNYGETYHATTSGYGAIDIIPANVNKATGIQYLLDYYGLTFDNVMAFGDGFNDLEMLEHAKAARSMPNGDPYLLEHFPHAIADNQRDGVLDTVIKELQLPLK
ncbi:Cof subfamily protein (haloacid dehalogenase superfamily) [Weissella uvarum]|uniref:HAD-IIB family hydrolase n=1 Tax=Weissella uvarum TaxID=1479233 RepID=UPI001961A48F|nr:HAD-IIB family hydrolase [Weissella uvarum]MBM7617437.1 Cof subfamily protein (haloacid dehalogenase superfamily) [Weissella uvarum]MCM0595678.1 HAD-IIB family hydrolase [Weissella uvarum]